MRAPSLLQALPGLLLSVCLPAVAQTLDTPQDSLPAAPRDTVRLMPLRMVGSVEPTLDSALLIREADVEWKDRRSTYDLLGQTPGVFVREQSSTGQYSEPTMRGAGWRSVAVLRDGRLLNDPASGVFNVELLPPLDIERVEVITGPRAFLHGLNGAGGTINVVTRNFAQPRPFTRVFYSQGPSLFSDFDGIFSQNLTRELNLVFSLQGVSTDGRFANAAAGAWNARVKLRYELSPTVSLILAERFTSSATELNGGIDLETTPPGQEFSPIGAQPVNTDTYDKITRHDLDLTLHGLFLGDSVSVSEATVYYSNNLREYRDEESPSRTNGIAVAADHRSSWTGIALRQSIVTGFQRFSVGGNVELRQVEGSPTIGRRSTHLVAAWASEEFRPAEGLAVGVFGRIDGTMGSTGTGYGADARIALAPGVTLFGGVSRSFRHPTATELFWTDSVVTRIDPIRGETHLLAEAGGEVYLAEAARIRLAGFYRRVDDPLVTAAFIAGSPFPGVRFANGEPLSSYGADLLIDARVWMLQIEGAGLFLVQEQAGADPRSFPAFSGSGGVYFRQTLLDSALHLKAGFRGRLATSHDGMLFNPEVLAYVPNGVRAVATGGAVDFVARAAIGDAIVHFVWENLTDAEYYGTPFYPAYARGVRFGITWDFLD